MSLSILIQKYRHTEVFNLGWASLSVGGYFVTCKSETLELHWFNLLSNLNFSYPPLFTPYYPQIKIFTLPPKITH